MFLHLILLAIHVILDEDNAQETIEMSNRIPVFAILSSPHCGHCIDVKPAWDNLTQHYINDTGIVIAEANCIEHRNACDIMYNLDGYPTFVYYIKGRATRIRPTRTLESFIEKSEELKKINFECFWAGDSITEHPQFVYYPPYGTDGCHVVKEIQKTCPAYAQYVAVGELSRNIAYFKAYMREGEKDEIAGLLSLEKMCDFMGKKMEEEKIRVEEEEKAAEAARDLIGQDAPFEDEEPPRDGESL